MGMDSVVSGSNPIRHRMTAVSIIQLLAVHRRPDGRARDEHRHHIFPFPALGPVLYADLLHLFDDVWSIGTTTNPTLLWEGLLPGSDGWDGFSLLNGAGRRPTFQSATA